MSERLTRLLFWSAAVLLALAGTFLVLDHTRLDSPTMDEPFHTLAAAEYAIAGTYYANLEHPPLMKLLAGASLKAAGARAPRIEQPFSMRTAEQPRPFSFQSPLSPGALFAAARRPFLVLFCALVLAAAGAVRHFAGGAAGLGAAALLAFEPNLLAQAGVVHTDLAAALGFFGTIVLVLLALEKRSLPLWAVAGLALGLTLASKFSAVLLVPMVAVLALVGVLRDRRSHAPAPLRPLAGLAIAGAVSAIALWGSYAVAMRSMSPDEARQAETVFLRSREAPQPTLDRVLAVSRVSPEIGHYAAGLTGIAVQNRLGGGVNYLHGRLSVDGFWDYFLVAFFVKSSVGLLLLLVLALVLLALRRARADFTILALFLPALYLFASGLATSYNIGIRHMLPVYPLLVAAAAIVMARGLPARTSAIGLALLATLQLAEVARVHPHEMSFFNAFVGGPAHGSEWLYDSNLDWGQDLQRLAGELSRRGWEGATVAYFGGADPAFYVPGARLFDAARTPITPGVYAVSSFLLCCGPEMTAFHGDRVAAGGYERLRRAVRTRGEPLGRVGYSILLFRIQESQ